LSNRNKEIEGTRQFNSVWPGK